VSLSPNIPAAPPILRLTGRMAVVCNWYHGDRIIGYKACSPEKDGAYTHGICPQCLARFTEENGLEPQSSNQ